MTLFGPPLASAVSAVAVALLSPAVGLAQDWYVTVQAGASLLGGSATETGQDCNQKGLPYAIADTGTVARLAVGLRRDSLGLELGYGRLGHYQRTLDYSDPRDDTVGEVVATQALDLRGLYYFGELGRLTPYAYLQGAAVLYQREVWKGHKAVNGAAVQQWNPRGGIAAVYAQWDRSNGTEFGVGGGIGAEYRVSSRLSATVEAGALFGPFEAMSATAGLRWKW